MKIELIWNRGVVRLKNSCLIKHERSYFSDRFYPHYLPSIFLVFTESIVGGIANDDDDNWFQDLSDPDNENNQKRSNGGVKSVALRRQVLFCIVFTSVNHIISNELFNSISAIQIFDDKGGSVTGASIAEVPIEFANIT